MKLIIECDAWKEGRAARQAQDALRSLGLQVEIREIRPKGFGDDLQPTIAEALSPFAIPTTDAKAQ